MMNGGSVEAGPQPAGADSARITRIYVGNSGDTTVSVIDHDSREVIKTIDIGAKHHGSVPSHAGDRIYLTTEDSGEVIAINTLNHEMNRALPTTIVLYLRLISEVADWPSWIPVWGNWWMKSR
jgi:YVTN family beta-propeller protein